MTDNTTETQDPDDTANAQNDPKDTTTAQDDAKDTAGQGDRRSTSEGPETERETAEKMVYYGQWIAFGFLVLLALVATIRLYTAASATIETFVGRRYRPLFVLGVNLAVVLGCGIGLSALVRRLT